MNPQPSSGIVGDHGCTRIAGASCQAQVAHDPAAALAHGDQGLAQMRQVLLDRETSNAASLLAIAVPKLCAGSIATEELMLDVDREIADPAGDRMNSW
jgi:hypothetical protein